MLRHRTTLKLEIEIRSYYFCFNLNLHIPSLASQFRHILLKRGGCTFLKTTMGHHEIVLIGIFLNRPTIPVNQKIQLVVGIIMIPRRITRA